MASALLGLGSVGAGVAHAQAADTTAPSVRVLSPANLSADLTGVIDVSVRATDAVGVASVEIEIDGVAVGDPITAPPYQRSINTTAYPPGQHLIRARARDAAGNVSTWKRVMVSFAGTTTRSVPGFVIQDSFVTGLTDATAFAQAPDGRFFVAQQGGAIRIVKNGALLATPFASLTVDRSSYERGLTGITLHPLFATNRRVFVYYTTAAGGVHNRVSRLLAQAGQDVSTGAETTVLDLAQLGNLREHQAGALKFGRSTGVLHIAVGEGGLPSNAQDLSNPFGKILRVREDGTALPTNPFYAQGGWAQYIYAYGLRNPYTMAYQRETGRMFVNDVGDKAFEEINQLGAGKNYGWPLSEGPTNLVGQSGPLFAYPQVPYSPPGSGVGGFVVGATIIGGAFYPTSGGSFPSAYGGDYFFADYVRSSVTRLHADDGWRGSAFARLVAKPVDMLVGNDGALYVLTRTGIIRIAPQ